MQKRKRKKATPRPDGLSRAEFARRQGVSTRMVSRYVEFGLPLTAGRRIDPLQAEKWLRDNLARSGDSESSQSFAAARARKETALADLRQLEVAVQRREVIPAQQANEYAVGLSRLVRDNLLSQPDRLAPILAALDDVDAVHKALASDVRSILEKLAKAIADTGL